MSDEEKRSALEPEQPENEDALQPDEQELAELEGLSLDELLNSVKNDLGSEGDGASGSGEKASMQPLFSPSREYEDAAEPQPEEPAAQSAARERLPAGVRTLVYVCCVLAASVLLAIFAWRCADDVLALTKADQDITVTVPENATIADVSRELKAKGLIRYEWLFKFYCWYSHAEQKIEPGTYELNNLYDYHALISGMAAASADRSTVTLTVPEGYECEDIFKLLAENGVCSVQELEASAAHDAFDYEFLQELPYGAANRLEGYLFPDTYEFYVDDDAQNVIDKFLRNFKSKLKPEMYDALDALNERLAAQLAANDFTEQEIANKRLTMHDIITVASLVEKETARTSESANIASVIYNRLCSKLYPCLELDATIQYALDERKEVLTNADKSIVSEYNTYRNAGLPAGPIANPGAASIRAALYPAETGYYFYALGTDGVHHFSENYYDHQAFLASLQGEALPEEDAQEAESDSHADTENQTPEA